MLPFAHLLHKRILRSTVIGHLQSTVNGQRSSSTVTMASNRGNSSTGDIGDTINVGGPSQQQLEKIRPINLPKFNPSAYRFWKRQAETTFNMYGCLGIITGMELRPVPSQNRPTTPAIRKAQHDWDIKHTLAIQALFNCLDMEYITSIYTLESAAEIWTKLEQEYGTKSIEEHTRAKMNWLNFYRSPRSTIDQHIVEFKKRLEEHMHFLPLDTPIPQRPEVNMQFMQSLRTSRDEGLPEKWSIMLTAMGANIFQMATEQLYATVRAKELETAKMNTDEEEAIAMM
jgi:hypothetical protein